MDCKRLANIMAGRIRQNIPPDKPPTPVWPVPHGGMQVAGLLAGRPGIEIVTYPRDAVLAIDDIIDSGRTAERIDKEYRLKTEALIDKRDRPDSPWYVFPWEVDGLEKDAQDLVTRQIQMIGDDPNRPGLIDTPERVQRSWEELFAGYGADVSDLLKLFPEETAGHIVVVKDIPFYSTCEHHLLPFYGEAHIAYYPKTENNKRQVIGLSKLPRLVDVISRRLQVQERITQQVADHVASVSDGAIVRLTGTHLCLTARGAKAGTTRMVTEAVAGDLSLRQGDIARSMLG